MKILLHEVLVLASIGALVAGLYAAVRSAREEDAARAKWRMVAAAGILLGFIGLALYRFQ